MSKKSFACKILLLGEGGVGKTSLRKAYLGEGFQQTYQMTIGADFAAKRITIGDTLITANIWDLAGQHRFKGMRNSYYRGVGGALLVFDLTRRDTFEAIKKWTDELKANNLDQLVPFVLIGNKSDLRETEDDIITKEESLALAKELSLNDNPVQYVETSAKTGEKVPAAFESLAEEILEIYTHNY